MRIKRIRIGIKDLKKALDDFVKTGESIERGEHVRKEAGTYFTSIEAFRQAITPKRLELLHIIKARKPASINELARMAKRDVKNVADDVRYMEQIGLIEKEGAGRKKRLIVQYDEVDVRIAV